MKYNFKLDELLVSGDGLIDVTGDDIQSVSVEVQHRRGGDVVYVHAGPKTIFRLCKVHVVEVTRR
jgi:hypothetical protein